MEAVPRPRPIHLVVRDDLSRNRLTVAFRLLLALPHIVWVLLWGIAAAFVAFLVWLAVLFAGQAPDGLHGFLATYLRYVTHVGAYLFLAANPYPGFLGRDGYPVDLVVAEPERQSRWSAGFRLILALPAIYLAARLGAGFSFGYIGCPYSIFVVAATAGTACLAALLMWFVALVRSSSPRGLRDLTCYAFGYAAQASGYLVLLTDRYPSSDPALAEEYAELPAHPVQVVVTDDLGRPRLPVAFRLLLSIPHFVWLVLWSVAVFFAAIAAWFAALFTGRVPTALHRFLAAYVRYSTHVIAYVYVIGRKFPGFTGRVGSYGIDVELAAPERQSRWKTLFRLFLAIPALLVNSALGGVLLAVGILGWGFALVMGRMPEGLRNLGAASLRYGAQSLSYVLLVTERYPYAAPVLEGRQQPEPDDLEPPPAYLIAQDES